MSSHRRSVNRPFPSSPHWVPTITVPGTTAPLEAPLLSRVGRLVLRVSLELLVQSDGHDLPAGRAQLATGQALDDGDGDRPRLHEPGVEEVPGEHPAQSVPQLLEADDDRLLRASEPSGVRALV